MKTIATGALAALTLAGTLAASAAPAAAQPWRGGYYHRGPGVGVAVGAGLAGLAVGAALADRPYYGYPAYGYPAYGYGYPAYGYYGPAPVYGYAYGPYPHYYYHHYWRPYRHW